VRREECPVISFDCGVDDKLIDHNRRFHAHLDALGIDHHYAEHAGGHTWDYRPHIHPVASYTASEIAAMAA